MKPIRFQTDPVLNRSGFKPIRFQTDPVSSASVTGSAASAIAGVPELD